MEEQINLPNHIEKYFNNKSKSSNFIELLEAENNNVDLRTDLSIEEIILVNTIILNGEFLKNRGLKNNIYERFINHYLRLKISKDRLSRQEFVTINKTDNNKETMEKLNTFANLKKVKE